MTYKKRAKAGYNNDKEVSNRKERTYEKELIEAELEAREREDLSEKPPVNDPDKFISSGKATKKKQPKYPEERKIRQLEKRIRQSEKFIRLMDGRSSDDWVSRHIQSSKHTLQKDKVKLQELQEKLQKKKEQDEKDID